MVRFFLLLTREFPPLYEATSSFTFADLSGKTQKNWVSEGASVGLIVRYASHDHPNRRGKDLRKNRLRVAASLYAGIALFAQQPDRLVVGWISDMGRSAPHGIGGRSFGPTTTQYERGTNGAGGQRVVSAMIKSWTPDFWISTGDMSNQRGNRAQTYKGLLFRSANEIVAPTSPSLGTLMQAVAPKSGTQVVQVSKRGSVGTFVFGFGTSNAEVVKVTARSASAPFTISAEFLKSHLVGEDYQSNVQTVHVDPLASDCPPSSCMNHLYLFGVSDVFKTNGSPKLNSITVSSGFADISIQNPERNYKATVGAQLGDEVIISGSGQPLLDGRYVVATLVTSNGQAAGTNVLRVATSAPDGTYAHADLQASFKRVAWVDTYLGVAEESPQTFEEIRMEGVSSTHIFTATFAKTHPVGTLFRGSDHVPYLDVIRAGKLIPVMGNHDNGGGEYDWCDGINDPVFPGANGCVEGNDFDAFNEYWRSPAGGGWPFEAGRPWFEKQYGNLVTFFSLDNSRGSGVFGLGTNQYNEMRPKMEACATAWCLPIVHFNTFAPECASRHNTNCSSPNYSQASYHWYAQIPKVAAIFSGHGHSLSHSVTSAKAGRAGVHQFMNGTGGDAINASSQILSDACVLVGDCQTLFWRYGGSIPRNQHGAGRLTITAQELKVEYFEVTNWLTPVYSYTLTNANPVIRQGDLDGDGDVDTDDLAVLQRYLNNPATTDDPKDLNRDGRIDALDARILTTLCTRSRCAVN